MSQVTKLRYKLSPEWKIHQTDTSLFIVGGADARYEIELENDEPSFFSSLKASRSFTRSDLPLKDQRVLEELVTAEVVAPVLQKGKKLKLAMIGDNNQLALNAQKSIQSAGLVIVIRTNSTYAELLEKINYQKLTKPHLLIDLAYHHTLSIGPLVFPGETACVACLQGRISTRWGDEAPPSSPKTTKQYSGVASELLKTELDRIKNNDTSLTGKTVSWNFKDRTVKTNQLLKVPICPICTQNKIDPNGTLALPWEGR